MKKDYTQRYYASYDKEKGHVTGWYDIQEMSSTAHVPPESELIKLTQEEWKTRTPNKHGVKNGKLVSHEQVADVIPQAELELKLVRQHIQHEHLMLNEQVPDTLVDYQKKLKKVISGELKKLPKKPKY